MSSYRRGTILGLTIAEIFILLAFLLLFALLLRQIVEDESRSAKKEVLRPLPWQRPAEVVTLQQAQHELAKAEQALTKIETERIDAVIAHQEARSELNDAKEAITDALQKADDFKKRDSLADAVRDLANRNMTLFRKGENPPCWYEEVPDGKGGTREKPHYAFDVAIYADSVELAPRKIPPGGALDDTDQLYVTEWRRIGIDNLPYGEKLSDAEFTAAVSDLVTQAKQRKVRSYECVLWVMVWDKTPKDAKQRWQNAHDQLIEGSFGAYRVRNPEELRWQDHAFSAMTYHRPR